MKKKRVKLTELEELSLGESKRVTFEEIAQGHTFTLSGAGRAKDGEHFWCAFCGGRGKNFYEVRRDDALKYLVGERCLGLVGLAKKDLPKPKVAKSTKPVAKAKVEMPDEDFTVEALDKLLEGL